MTTYSFQLTGATPFSFQPTLDGSTYNVTVTWNIFGQRWYVNCYDLSGNLVFAVPLTGSPLAYPISLAAGFFTSTLVFYTGTQTFVVSP